MASSSKSGLWKSVRSFYKPSAFLLASLFALSLFLFPSSSVHAACPACVAGGAPYWPECANYYPTDWPADNAWIAYTSQGNTINDPRTNDPSNGGARPQNYVNISSGCPDQSKPSLYFYYNSTANMLFFRWRVEQIPNNYATGPSPGAYQAVSPWWSALWTIFIDTNGDGFRDYAMFLDGSSGIPSAPVDVLQTIYSNTLSNHIDPHLPGIASIATNPTGFVDRDASCNSTNTILNFHNILTPDTSWPNGSGETVWDYGTTRSVDISFSDSSPCGVTNSKEFFADYQIPIQMLGGSVPFDCSAPAAMLFATANSITNPFQKDLALNGSFVATPDQCAPFGDLVILCPAGGGPPQIIPQPVVDWVTAAGCGPATLTASVRAAMQPPCSTTVSSVQFYYYFDKNNDGQPNDAGSSWTLIASGVNSTTDPALWTYSWDSSNLPKGQYLIGVKATDLNGRITWSYLSSPPGATPPNYVNPSPKPGIVYGTFNNNCGKAATVTKSAASINPPYAGSPYALTGQPFTFTITVTNYDTVPLTLNKIIDILPPTFSYNNTPPETVLPAATFSTPSNGAMGTIQWTFSPAVTLAAGGGSQTLTFTSNVGSVTGTYTNVAQADTTEKGIITSNPVDVGVGAPRLTIQKMVSKYFANAGDTLVYTMTYSNDSPVDVHNVVIRDPLPVGFTYTSISNGGTYDAATRTVTWNIGTLGSLEGPYTVTVTGTVDTNPAPAKLVNVAYIRSTETPEISSGVDVTVYINTPLLIQKTASPIIFSPGNQVTFTIQYRNNGSTSQNNVVITDPIPAGFTFVSAAAGTNCPAGVNSSGIVTWTFTGGLNPLLAGTVGTCNLVLQATNPFTGNVPTTTNTVGITATGLSPVYSSAAVTENSATCTSPTTYYFHNQTTNVGASGTLTSVVGGGAVNIGGSQKIANTTAPTGSTPIFITSPQTSSSGGTVAFAQFYVDPPVTDGGSFAGTVTVNYWAQKRQGNPNVFVELWDYNPATGAATNLGSQTGGGAGGNIQNFTMTFTPSGTVSQGHRLLWVFYVNGNGSSVDFYYDSTAYNSYSTACLTPMRLEIQKGESKLAVSASGDTLTYTITFSNSGLANATGSQIVDTLDPNTSFTSATLNGGPVTPVGGSCPANVCTFNVNSPGQGAGVIAPGASGTLVINVNVNPIPAGTFQLMNTASISSNQTQPVSVSVPARVITNPYLSVIKSADKTRLIPGDTVTFTLTVLSSGMATASNVVLTDNLSTINSQCTGSGTPYSCCTGNGTGTCTFQDSYFTYVLNSASNGGVYNSGTQTITWNLGDMASGAIQAVTFQMQVSSTINPPDTTSGVPLGVTSKSNAASAVSQSVTYLSNELIVSISPNANLQITKTVSNISNTKAVVQGTDLNYYECIASHTSSSTNEPTTGVSWTTYWRLCSSCRGNAWASGQQYSPTVPGDTLEYTMTLTNIGGSDATSVLVTDPIPSNATYKSGTIVYQGVSQTDILDGDNGYFDALNNRVFFAVGTGASGSTGGTLAKAASVTMKFRATLLSKLPNGTTTIANTATASASNTASKQATANIDAVSSPVLNLTKSAPSVMAYPLTTSPSQQNNVTTFTVRSAQFIEAGDVIFIDSVAATATVTAVNKSANTVQVSTTVSPQNNANIYGTFNYVLNYQNTGSTDATNVVVSDALPANLLYISSSPAASSAPAVNTNGTVTWSLGAVPAGGYGRLTVRVRPSAVGTYTNTGTITSTETPAVNSSATTVVGGLTLTKSTSTPNVTNSATGTTATYTITMTNQGSVGATGIAITDTLPIGFSYASTSSFTGCGGATTNPTANSNTPRWTCALLNSGGTITITFVSNIAATVGAGTYQNPVAATSTNSTVIPFDELNTTAEDVTVAVPYDLAVTKTVQSVTSPECRAGACTVIYLITVRNVGSFAVNNAQVTDVLPAGLTYSSNTPSQGSYNSGTGVWTVGTVNTAGSATLSLTANVTTSSTIVNCATITGWSALTPDTNSGNNTSCASLVPTQITLSGFRALNADGRMLIEWTTASEVGTLGFYLFRRDEVSGAYDQINNRLLTGLLSARQGGTYSLIDLGADVTQRYTYVLVEVEGSGERYAYGPFTVEAGENAPQRLQISERVDARALFDREASLAKRSSVESSTVSTDGASVLTVRNISVAAGDLYSGYTKKAREKVRPLTKGSQRQAALIGGISVGSRIKITVSKDGLYFMDAAGISSLLGIRESLVRQLLKSGLLTLSSHGSNVDYMPASDYSGLYFYGEGADSPYTKDNIYWLSRGRGSFMGSVAGHGPEPYDGYEAFGETAHFEEDKIDIPGFSSDPASNYWFWDYVESGYPGMDSKAFLFTVDGVAETTVPASLSVRLKGISDAGASPAHHAIISLNGTMIGEELWGGNEDHEITLTVDQSLIRDGQNSLEIAGALIDGVDYSLIFINSFDVTYQRNYRAAGDSLLCRGDGNSVVTIGGFTSADISLFDVSNALRPKVVTAKTIAGSDESGYSVSFAPASPGASYLAVGVDAMSAAKGAASNAGFRLKARSNSADYLIITVADLKAAALKLAAYRGSKGLRVMVVDLQDVMDEFNYGVYSPLAIKSFLAYTQKGWLKAPRYVVLAGDGSYDYKDNYGYGDNLIPAMMVSTPHGISPSDNFYADINNNGVPEIAVGRLPAKTSEELQAIIDKIISYERVGIGAWQRRILMIADNPDDGANFPMESDEVASLLPWGYAVEKIYLPDHPFDEARRLVMNGINGGAGALNFIGHAAVDRLTQEGLITSDDIEFMTNAGAFPVVTAMTCDVGFFAIPGYDSLAEDLVLKQGGGAVAVWAPSGLAIDSQSVALDKEFYGRAFGSGRQVLGDVILKALKKYASMGYDTSILGIYTLLGDPAMKLRGWASQ